MKNKTVITYVTKITQYPKTFFIVIILFSISALGFFGFSGIFSYNKDIKKISTAVDKHVPKEYTYTMKKNEINIQSGASVIFDDITITTKAMGHKIMEDRSSQDFTSLEISHGNNLHVQNIFKGDVLAFESYLIKVEEIADDGAMVTLSFSKSEPTDSSETVTIKSGETTIVFDLTIQNVSGGHEFVDNGNDASFAELTMKTPRKSMQIFSNVFTNNKLQYDSYNVKVDKVDFDASSVTVTIINNKSIKTNNIPPPTIDNIFLNESILLGNEISISPNETVTIDDLTITHSGGGHKILARVGGGGDLSYAEITLETPRKAKQKNRLMNYGRVETVKFDNFVIFAKRIGWNGTGLVLSVRKEV